MAAQNPIPWIAFAVLVRLVTGLFAGAEYAAQAPTCTGLTCLDLGDLFTAFALGIVPGAPTAFNVLLLVVANLGLLIAVVNWARELLRV